MSMPHKHLLLLAALGASFMAAPTTALAGQSSPTAGVHIDPSSPVAKEYALPLATARGAPADTGSTGSLFGSGITKHSGSQRRATSKSMRPNDGNGGSETTASNPVTETSPTTSASPVTETPPSTSTAASPATETPATTSASPTTTTATPSPHLRHHHRRRAVHEAQRQVHPSRSAGTPVTASRRAAATPAATRILHPGAGTSWLWMLVAALAVLTLGGGGAFLVARMRERAPDPNAS